MADPAINRVLNIAFILEAEYLTQTTYTKEKAITILSNCVLPTALCNLLLANEQEIIKLLPHD